MAKVEYNAVGRRKTAIARVRLVAGDGKILINKRDLAAFKKILASFDNTFAYVSSVNDVYGRFFRNNVL